jgi:hypothetical protein
LAAPFVLWGGRFRGGAAVALMVRSACRVRVFSLNHLVPTDRRMVVTGADPSRRIVREINAEPAAREYARLLGKDPEQLTTFTFAAHPVVVRLGGRHHVRAIQRMEPNGDLVFFSAIDEGLVLTLAEPQDMAAHLERSWPPWGPPAPPPRSWPATASCAGWRRRKSSATGRFRPSCGRMAWRAFPPMASRSTRCMSTRP